MHTYGPMGQVKSTINRCLLFGADSLGVCTHDFAHKLLDILRIEQSARLLKITSSKMTSFPAKQLPRSCYCSHRAPSSTFRFVGGTIEANVRRVCRRLCYCAFFASLAAPNPQKWCVCPWNLPRVASLTCMAAQYGGWCWRTGARQCSELALRGGCSRADRQIYLCPFA